MRMPRVRFTVRGMMIAVAVAGILLSIATYLGRMTRQTLLTEARKQLDQATEARRIEADFLDQAAEARRMEARILDVTGRAELREAGLYFSGRASQMNAMATAKERFASEVFLRYGIRPQPLGR